MTSGASIAGLSIMMGAIFLAALSSPNAANAAAVVYPAPQGAVLSQDYTITVDGKPLDAYTAPTWQPTYAPPFGGPYSFAYFDMSGPVQVRITSNKKPLDNLVILPAARGIKPQVTGNTMTFTLDRPCQLSIEPEAKFGPLLLFANPIEETPPDAKDPNVRYFGPGMHKPGAIELTDGQTLYIAGGAVVKGGIRIRGKNIHVRGRGVLDGLDWERFKGPTNTPMGLDRASEVTVEGIIIKDSWSWTFNIVASQNVTVRNVKICSSRCENNDGIDICNSQHVLIEDCFIRTDDDSISPKGMSGNLPVDDLTIQRCVLWTDRAHVWRFGAECRAEAFRNITNRDIDVIHFPEAYGDGYGGPKMITLQPAEDMPMENIRFENIRIHGEGQKVLIEVRPYATMWAKKKTPGSVHNCVFKDITVYGQTSGRLGKIVISAPDDQHPVENVRLANIVRYGQPLLKDSPELEISGSVKDIVVVGPEK